MVKIAGEYNLILIEAISKIFHKIHSVKFLVIQVPTEYNPKNICGKYQRLGTSTENRDIASC